LYDINILFFITDGKIDDYTGFDTTAHSFYKHKFMCYSDLNKCIPIVKHLEKFEKMYSEMLKRVQMLKLDDSFYSINGTITENLRILEHNGLKVDVELFNRHFENKTVKDKDGYVYTQYNLYTATGRPSNRFGNVNYSALNKENGCRSSFISRYGDDGMLFMIDYSAYHPHIVAKLINYNLPPNAYEYLGRLYYGKDSLTEDEIKASKNLTFQCMYGNIPSELLEVPYYKKMSDYIAHRWKFFNENGYVETPIYKRRITTNHINEPNPNKLFNYILQASETEFGMQSLVRVNEYLECNKKQTKAILYTYDSVLFDCHKGDKKETLVELKRLMSNSQFPVKCYIGRNYNEMTVVDI
jgi:DNA polymerase I-like protein with 3'-5' exonuclease and polymerase domains